VVVVVEAGRRGGSGATSEPGGRRTSRTSPGSRTRSKVSWREEAPPVPSEVVAEVPLEATGGS